MADTIDHQQWSIILGADLLQKPDDAAATATTTADATSSDANNTLTQWLLAGEYGPALKSTVASDIFGTQLADTDPEVLALESSLNLSAFLSKRIQSYLSTATPTASSTTSSAALDVLSVGIASLYAFVQAGWTGPELGFEPIDLLPAHVRAKAKDLDKQALDKLSVGGEELYHLSPQILFLHFARILLVDHLEDLKKDPLVAKSAPWWAIRTLFLQQRTLEGPTGLLQEQMVALMDELEAVLTKEVS
jgi:hypothetical protein